MGQHAVMFSLDRRDQICGDASGDPKVPIADDRVQHVIAHVPVELIARQRDARRAAIGQDHRTGVPVLGTESIGIGHQGRGIGDQARGGIGEVHTAQQAGGAERLDLREVGEDIGHAVLHGVAAEAGRQGGGCRGGEATDPDDERQSDRGDHF